MCAGFGRLLTSNDNRSVSDSFVRVDPVITKFKQSGFAGLNAAERAHIKSLPTETIREQANNVAPHTFEISEGRKMGF